MKRLLNFLDDLQQSLKIFTFFIILLTVLRIIFIGIFWDKVPAEGIDELGQCLWLGFRLSLKTAGIVAFIGFVFGALPRLVISKWPAEIIRNIVAYIGIFLFILGIFVRVPYYKIYNSGFNFMLLNALKDDKAAIFRTAVEEYHFYPALACVLFITLLLFYGLNKVIKTKNWAPKINDTKQMWVYIATLLVVLPMFFVFIRFGGGYNYGTGINWENAGRLNTHLFNEAILDDGQALYKVWGAQKRLRHAVKMQLNETKLKESIVALGGNPDAGSIDKAMERTITTQLLPNQPQNVVLILGENYAVWPFLDEYKGLNLVPYGKRMIESGHAAYTLNFLPQGNETVTATNALITGLDNLTLYENYQSVSYKSKYAGGIGNIMKQNGYTTYFWYGGFSTWQAIEKFALAQGFDKFISADDFPYAEGNAWGAADEYLFKAIKKHMTDNPDEKAFHFILTMSNHAPYVLDVEKHGFSYAELKKHRPDSIPNDDETLKHMGHIWYSDKMLGEFIEYAEKLHDDTLFAVVGDHAARFDFSKEASLQELYGIPFIVYGKNVKPEWFKSNSTGSQMQVPGTLAEIIGKKGDKYTALVPSLFSDLTMATNIHVCINKGIFGDLKKADADIKFQSQNARVVSSWRTLKGNEF